MFLSFVQSVGRVIGQTQPAAGASIRIGHAGGNGRGWIGPLRIRLMAPHGNGSLCRVVMRPSTLIRLSLETKGSGFSTPYRLPPYH